MFSEYASTTSLMISSATALHLLFFGLLMLFILVYLLYIFWPTNHTDFRY